MPEINAVSFFCDDVRQEASGKLTIVGMYRTYLGLAETNKRLLLPKLVGLLMLEYPARDVGRSALVRLLNNDDVLVEMPISLPTAGLPTPVTRSGDPANATIPIELIPFEPKQGMRLQIDFECADFHFRGPVLEVRVGPPQSPAPSAAPAAPSARRSRRPRSA